MCRTELAPHQHAGASSSYCACYCGIACIIFVSWFHLLWSTQEGLATRVYYRGHGAEGFIAEEETLGSRRSASIT